MGLGRVMASECDAGPHPHPHPLAHPDPYVKVYLLQDGRKMSKKKTAVKKDDPNPVFNEAMIFSVPAIVLQVRRK